MSVSMSRRQGSMSPPRSPGKLANRGFAAPTLHPGLMPPWDCRLPPDPRSPVLNSTSQASGLYPSQSPNSRFRNVEPVVSQQSPGQHHHHQQLQQQGLSVSPSRRAGQFHNYGSLASQSSVPLLAAVQRPLIGDPRAGSPTRNQRQDSRPISPVVNVPSPERVAVLRGNATRLEGPPCPRCRSALLADAAFCRMCGMQRQDRSGSDIGPITGGSTSSASECTPNGYRNGSLASPSASSTSFGIAKGSRDGAVVSPSRRPVTVEVAGHRDEFEGRRRVSVDVCKAPLVHVAPLPSSPSTVPQSGDTSLSPLRGSRVRRANEDGSSEHLSSDAMPNASQPTRAQSALDDQTYLRVSKASTSSPSGASFGGAFPGGSLAPTAKGSDVVRRPLVEWGASRVIPVVPSRNVDYGCDITDGSAQITASSGNWIAEGPCVTVDIAQTNSDGAGKTESTRATCDSACSPNAAALGYRDPGWVFYSDAEMIEFAERTLCGVVAPTLLRRLTRREIVTLVMAQLDMSPSGTPVATSPSDATQTFQTGLAASEKTLPLALGRFGEARPGDAAGGGGGAIAKSALAAIPPDEQPPPISEQAEKLMALPCAIEPPSAVVSPPMMVEMGNPWLPQERFDSPQSELVRALAKAESALAFGTTTSEPPVVAIPPMSLPVTQSSAGGGKSAVPSKDFPTYEESQGNLVQEERTKRLLRNEDTLRQLAEGAHRLLIQAKIEGTQRWEDSSVLVRGGRWT